MSTIDSKSIDWRATYKDFDNKIDMIDKSSKLYFISQNTNGIDYWVARYTFTPFQLNGNSWSIGTKYNDNDIWTQNITYDDWKKELKEYDYVYLFKIDEKFLNEFKNVFIDTSQVSNKQLYEVINEGDNVILNLVEE
jgi:hypothetical protein